MSVSKPASADNAELTLHHTKWADNQPDQAPPRARALSPGAERLLNNHPLYMTPSVAGLTAELLGLGQRGDWA